MAHLDPAFLFAAAYAPPAAAAPSLSELQSEARRTRGEMAALQPLVSAFFGKVLVMAKDEKVRNNRLALLKGLSAAFSAVADFEAVFTVDAIRLYELGDEGWTARASYPLQG